MTNNIYKNIFCLSLKIVLMISGDRPYLNRKYFCGFFELILYLLSLKVFQNEWWRLLDKVLLLSADYSTN